MMLDAELLVHLAKHGMSEEVGRYLNSAGAKARLNTYEPPDPSLVAEHDSINGASLDTEPRLRDIAPNFLGDVLYDRPTEVLRVEYRSGREQVFRGRQARDLAPAVIAYCEWLSTDPRERTPHPPELPEQLK